MWERGCCRGDTAGFGSFEGFLAKDDGVVEVWGKDLVPEPVDKKTVGEILGGEVFGDLVA